MSERLTVDRKEFAAFLSDNQALLERSQELIEKIDALENVNKQLRDELKVSKEKLESLETTMNTSKSQSDESLRRVQATLKDEPQKTKQEYENHNQPERTPSRPNFRSRMELSLISDRLKFSRFKQDFLQPFGIRLLQLTQRPQNLTSTYASCGRCGFPIREASRFCTRCGMNFGCIICPCGQRLSLGAKYCDRCRRIVELR